MFLFDQKTPFLSFKQRTINQYKITKPGEKIIFSSGYTLIGIEQDSDEVQTCVYITENIVYYAFFNTPDAPCLPFCG